MGLDELDHQTKGDQLRRRPMGGAGWRSPPPRPKAAQNDEATLSARSADTRRQRIVELAGIEPASSSAEPGLLRVQFVMAVSQPRHSHEQVADGLSQESVPVTPPDRR